MLRRRRLKTTQLWPRRLVLILATLSLCCYTLPALAQPNRRDTSRSRNAEIRFSLCELASAGLARKRLNRPANFVWDKLGLRTALQQVEENLDVVIWLDRRVDPNQLVSLIPAPGTSIFTGLQKVAAEIGCEAVLVENILLFARSEDASRIQAAAVRLHNQLSISQQGANAVLHELGWQDLAEPNSILQVLAADRQIRLDGTLPHDLWHAKQLKIPSTLATHLSLLAGGFDMQAVLVAPGQYRFEPLSEESEWLKSYPRTVLGRASMRDLSKLKLQKKAKVRVERDSILATGNTSFHVALLNIGQEGQSTAGVDPKALERPWPRIEIERKPVEVIIQAIQARTGLQVSWNPAVTATQRQTLVSFSLTDVDLDTFLQTIAREGNLHIERKGSSATIRPR